MDSELQSLSALAIETPGQYAYRIAILFGLAPGNDANQIASKIVRTTLPPVWTRYACLERVCIQCVQRSAAAFVLQAEKNMAWEVQQQTGRSAASTLTLGGAIIGGGGPIRIYVGGLHPDLSVSLS